MSAGNGITRRDLLQTAVVVMPMAMTGCAGGTRDRSNDEEPELRADDPVARSLAYYPDTRDVPADHPLARDHDVSQKCANCIHQQGSAGRGRLECPTFPGRNVSEEGWCTLWAQRPTGS